MGVLLATALARSGLAVAVAERGPLAGRQQEWNISRDELKVSMPMHEMWFTVPCEATVVTVVTVVAVLVHM